MTKALAQLYIRKDNLEAFRQVRGELYQWWLRSDPIKLEGKPQPMANQSAAKRKKKKKKQLRKQTDVKIPSHIKMVLQLYINGKWKDWVYIARSGRVHAAYGLYAARDFCSNTMIGFYMGPVIWEASVEGGYEATDEELEAAGVVNSAYSLQLRNNHCRCVVVDPKSIGPDETDETCLFMGMHYMNNPCLDYQRGTPGYFKARKEINCLLLEDGCVQAIRKITPGTELLTGYHTDQHRPKKMTGGLDNDVNIVKKPSAKKPAAKKSVGKKRAATTIATKKSVAKKPAAKKYTPKKHSRSHDNKRKFPKRSSNQVASK